MSSLRNNFIEMKLIDSQKKLKLYVDNLNNKLDFIKWKQGLLLKYSYVPFDIIKQKIQKDRLVYLQKLSEGEGRLKKQLKNQYVQEQVSYAKQLGNKLCNQMKQIESQIQIIKINNKIYEASLTSKKQNLKYLIKENMELNKTIISLKNYRNQNTQKGQNNDKNNEKQISHKTKAILTMRSKLSEQIMRAKTASKKETYQYKSSINTTTQTYNQCLKYLIKTLRGMNGIEDVQTGIYLQIMNRKAINREATYSLKSKTCDILMDRYKDLREVKPKASQDFSMSYETFQGLNYKQIMGIVLVKDRSAFGLKNLLQLK